MKKITLFIFSFLGIYTLVAQKLPQAIDTVITGHKPAIAGKQVKNDSLAAKEKHGMRLFPNPAKNKVEIEIKGFETGYVQLQLLDNEGQLLKEEQRLVLGGNDIIVIMFSQKPGLYYIILRQYHVKLKTRLVIQ